MVDGEFTRETDWKGSEMKCEKQEREGLGLRQVGFNEEARQVLLVIAQ